VETTICTTEDGNALQTVATPIKLHAKSTNTCLQTLSLPTGNSGRLQPRCGYYALFQDSEQDGANDDYVTPFGIREAEVFGERGFHPEWRSTKLKGVCIHHTLIPAGPPCRMSCGERVIKELQLQDAHPSGRRIIAKPGVL